MLMAPTLWLAADVSLLIPLAALSSEAVSAVVPAGEVVTQADQPRGVAPGVDAVLVPDVETAQQIVGSSSRVESGNVDAYVATYSPELDVGYYAVTADQGKSSAEARRLVTAHLQPAKGPPQHQTVVVYSQYTAAQIDQSLAALSGTIGASGVRAAFFYVPAEDAITLWYDAKSDGVLALPEVAVPVKVVGGSVLDSLYREDMRAPFRAGGTIYDTGGGRCTSGIAAFNANGSPGYFTAAHCFALSQWVFSSDSLAGASNTGTVSHRYGTGAVDAEFVSAKSYTGHVFTGWDLQTSKPVIGTHFPAAGVGNRLCFSGSTTGVQCGNALVTYAGNFCGETGCNSDHLALRGGTSSQPGDSGAPVFANFADKAKVSGIIRAHVDPWIGESTTFAVDWRRIAATYNATLMYG
jgi:hypothetical protein